MTNAIRCNCCEFEEGSSQRGPGGGWREKVNCEFFIQ